MTAGFERQAPVGDAVEASLPSDREIVVSRRFNAPRELVWAAWTHPEHIGNWWGPDGFTTTTEKMELRPGGEWRFVMHAPNGMNFQNYVQYSEVVEPERLVYLHGEDEERIDFEVTVTFVERDGATEVTLRQVYETAEARDRAIEEVGAIEGGKQTLDRLAGYLETMRS